MLSDINKKKIGDIGENYAVKYLKKKRYKIIERNFRSKTGEVDIICSKKDTLVFVEVKARSNSRFGTPAEAVNYYKQKKIILCTKYYLMKHKISNMNIRFDVIEIFLDNNYKLLDINHIENAFWER